MSKWFDIETNPPKSSGEYLVHMVCEDDKDDDLIDVDLYFADTKEWASNWFGVKPKQWTYCPKPKGYVGQKYKFKLKAK